MLYKHKQLTSNWRNQIKIVPNLQFLDLNREPFDQIMSKQDYECDQTFNAIFFCIWQFLKLCNRHFLVCIKRFDTQALSNQPLLFFVDFSHLLNWGSSEGQTWFWAIPVKNTWLFKLIRDQIRSEIRSYDSIVLVRTSICFPNFPQICKCTRKSKSFPKCLPEFYRDVHRFRQPSYSKVEQN